MSRIGFLVLSLPVLLAGCTQQMANQRRLDALEPREGIVDQSDVDPTPPHVVQASDAARGRPTHSASGIAWESGINLNEPLDLSRDLRRALLRRGRERFLIHCVPCHDRSGSGNGMAARRGMTFPPSYHTPRLRNKPLPYFYKVISEGKNKMPAYGDQIRESDRWAIAAYVRALQLSQYVPASRLSEEDRQQLAGATGPGEKRQDSSEVADE
ncbi:c-type cytochrome [Roseiconus nitratireducens]|nr:cytochrome c [Roseiconus nitratireducens]